jgi:hypothetical protein
MRNCPQEQQAVLEDIEHLDCYAVKLRAISDHINARSTLTSKN